MKIRTHLITLTILNIGVSQAPSLYADDPEQTKPASVIPIVIRNDSMYPVFIAANPEGYNSIRLNPNEQTSITVPAPEEPITSGSPSHRDKFIAPAGRGIYSFYFPQKMLSEEADTHPQNDQENVIPSAYAPNNENNENDDTIGLPRKRRRIAAATRAQNQPPASPRTPKSAFSIMRQPRILTLPPGSQDLEFFPIDIIHAFCNPHDEPIEASVRTNNTVILQFYGPYYSAQKGVIIEEPHAELSMSF